MRALSVVALVIVLSDVTGQKALSVPVSGSETVVFWDACYQQLYAMNPDGTGRRATAVNLTATTGSGIESQPHWGWR